MKYPVKISVVMPCYNYGKFVSKSIDSILQQSFEDFEFIIVNDGSGDNSHEEIVKYTDKRIRYVSLDSNRGNFPARNIGMRMATGKYICVMDADDIAHPDRLQFQFDYLEKRKKVGAVGTQGRWIEEDGTVTEFVFHRPVVSWRQFQTFLLVDSQVIHPSLMVRSHLVRQHDLYYNEKYRTASDYDFLIRCASRFPVYNIDKELIFYRSHDNQISRIYRPEQKDFADQIRIGLLKNILKTPTGYEIDIYLKLVRKIYFSDVAEFNTALDLVNSILASNYQLKIYNQSFLYVLFGYLMTEAKEYLVNASRKPHVPNMEISSTC